MPNNKVRQKLGRATVNHQSFASTGTIHFQEESVATIQGKSDHYCFTRLQLFVNVHV